MKVTSPCRCGAPGKKRDCRCGIPMCEECWAVHGCPALLAISKKAWQREDQREGGLKLATAELLDAHGIYYERINAGGFRGRARGAKAGVGDFFVFPGGGRFGAIETKATHVDCNRKTCGCSGQREWRAEWERRGGFYILAFKLDDVYLGLGLPLPMRQEVML